MSTEQNPEPRPTAERWRRYGRDRLYVTGPESVKLGYRDLLTGEDHPENPECASLLAETANSWSAVNLEPAAPEVPVAAATGRPWVDLSLNLPGSELREQALARRAQAPVKTALARVLNVHTDERAWRMGAVGEEKVAKELGRLTKRSPEWTAIHGVPVGRRGSDIDHVVMGPGGVFTLNTKCHPEANLWIGGDTFMVNGKKTPYVRNARYEAGRASRLLTEATGFSVHVEALIVPVLSNAPTIKSQPGDGVHVVPRRRLCDWFGRLGPVLDRGQLAIIWDVARRSTTWSR